MSHSHVRNIYESKAPLPAPKKRGTEVKIIYTRNNFEQAIKEAKQQMKRSNLNDSKKPSQEQKPLSSTSEIFFTETFKKKYQDRLSELQEKKKQLVAQSLEKQMQAKLQRKIRQNIDLRDKMSILRDVQQRRENLIKEQNLREKRKKEEKRLLHESTSDKVEMIRKSKAKIQQRQLANSRMVEQESYKSLQFKNYTERKQFQEKQMILKSRMQFLIKSKSSRGFNSTFYSRSQNRSSLNRQRQLVTSHTGRKINEQRRQDNEEEASDNESALQKSEAFSQKKYNQGARTPRCQAPITQDRDREDSNNGRNLQIQEDDRLPSPAGSQKAKIDSLKDASDNEAQKQQKQPSEVLQNLSFKSTRYNGKEEQPKQQHEAEPSHDII